MSMTVHTTARVTSCVGLVEDDHSTNARESPLNNPVIEIDASERASQNGRGHPRNQGRNQKRGNKRHDAGQQAGQLA